MNRGIRIRGAFLIVLGTFLAGFMVYLIQETSAAMAPPYGGGGSDVRFTGTASEGQSITNLLTGLLVLGIGAALYGLFMALTGRESRVVRFVAILLLIAMIVASLFLVDTPDLITRIF